MSDEKNRNTLKISETVGCSRSCWLLFRIVVYFISHKMESKIVEQYKMKNKKKKKYMNFKNKP